MIRWMAEHKVAANLLMMIILLSGLMGALNIKQEVFPEFELDYIVIAVPYSGATPEEIEKSILLPIEDAVGGIDGIKKVTGTANEGMGSFRIEILNGADKNSVFEDVKTAVDRLTSLPDEAKYSVRLTIIASLFLLKFYRAYGVRLLIGLYPGE